MQCGRNYVEDLISISHCTSLDGTTKCALFTVYEVNGGAEAATYAQQRLHRSILEQQGFFAKDAQVVIFSIKEAFLQVHAEMKQVKRKFLFFLFSFVGIVN